MRINIMVLSLSLLALAGCSFSPIKQNHLGLVDAPHGVIVDSKRASNPAPFAMTIHHGWKRSGIQKQAEIESIRRDAPYASLK